MTTYARLNNIAAALKTAINEHLANHDLPAIDTVTVGITSVLGDMSFYPALLVAEKGRSYESRYWTTYDLLIGVAVRSDDPDHLSEVGEGYVDAVEQALKGDCTLGGNAITSRMAPAEVGCVSGIMVAAFSVSADVDTGGTAHGNYDVPDNPTLEELIDEDLEDPEDPEDPEDSEEQEETDEDA